MSFSIQLIPAFQDNYIFLLKDKKTNQVCLVDPGAAKPCLDELRQQNYNLTTILITHHHSDHIDGIIELKMQFPKLKIYAPLKNKNQIPEVDFYVQDGDEIDFGFAAFKVIELPGHTMGHVAYDQPHQKTLFSGDVLFGLGCGRLFEGSPEDMFKSLQRIKSLSIETQIYCTHEYTETNLKFVDELIVKKQMPENFSFVGFNDYKSRLVSLRDNNNPSVPLQLKDEMKCNPFLLAQTVNQFTVLREARNNFRPK